MGVGEHVYTDGEPAARVVFVVSGTLEAGHDSGGRRLVLGTIEPGAWMGEIGFIDNGPATATVVAKTPTVLLCIHHAQLLQLADVHPEAASVLLRQVTRVLAERLQKSSAGIVRKLSDDRFIVEPVEETRGWLSRTLSWLVGVQEVAA
jgi:CRP-like cAMP-binding protein